MKIRNLF